MDWKNLYLSFNGRINRQPFWLGLLAFMIVIWIVEFLLFAALGGSMMQVAPNASKEAVDAAAQAMMGKISIPIIILSLLTLWPTLAIYTKRWHDRDKSGWWSLIMFVPFIGAIWLIVECGFLRGTEGPNRFGDDPLAGQ